jgi:hypothetical protein
MHAKYIKTVCKWEIRKKFKTKPARSHFNLTNHWGKTALLSFT